MPDQSTPQLPTKVSTRATTRPDRKAVRRAELEHQAEERRRVLEYDRVARIRAARLRKRKRLFWWTFPLVLLALVAAGKALSVPIIANGADDRYDEEDFEGAASRYHWLQTFNVAEEWKVHFDEGTSLLRADNLQGAIDELFLAHDVAPAAPTDLAELPAGTFVPVCAIQTNLAVAHELQGDVTQAVGDGHVERMKREQGALDALGTDIPTDGTAPDPDLYKDLAIESFREAEGLYQEANDVRTWNECPDDDPARERNVEKDTSAREKREALENPPPPPPPEGGGEGDPQEPEDPQDPQDPETGEPQDPQTGEPQDPETGEPQEPLTPEEQRRKELDERNQQGEEERRDTEGWINDGEGGGTEQNW